VLGPQTSVIAPATRICITNTPLEPIAAFCLCNVARIRNGDRILDPYCGSGTTLLAAAMIAPDSKTVGIEIAHNGLVNRGDILKDFSSRSLSPPRKLICGDSTHASTRAQARTAVGGQSFDAIISDPPYGIRESSNYNDKSPLEELFACIQQDRDLQHRLLRVGGRVVAFVPVTDEQTLWQMLPTKEVSDLAGLEFEVCREQPLNEKLSRWLVSYTCVR
jgi:tRNA G10  N-methylase Trm11